MSPIHNTAALEDHLSEPTPALVDLFRRHPGDVLLLGVAGKIGPSLARMIRRAADQAGTPRRVIGVSRFRDPAEAARLQSRGIETLPCDLLDETALARLPDAPLVAYLVGWKFGSQGQTGRLWAVNTYLPGVICRRFRRSRIVAYSTGNVYGMVPAGRGGSVETDELCPVGEYAMSCVGRERVMEHFSRELEIPLALIRLNYACDLRYGVLVDIARRIWDGHPVDLATGWFNTIWQGDANAFTLLAFDHAAVPPCVLNVTGPESLRVRDVALALGERLKRPVEFTGSEAETALLSDAGKAIRQFGPLRVSASELIDHVAAWISQGGEHLGKPTRFDRRDGKF